MADHELAGAAQLVRTGEVSARGVECAHPAREVPLQVQRDVGPGRHLLECRPHASVVADDAQADRHVVEQVAAQVELAGRNLAVLEHLLPGLERLVELAGGHQDLRLLVDRQILDVDAREQAMGHREASRARQPRVAGHAVARGLDHEEARLLVAAIAVALADLLDVGRERAAQVPEAGVSAHAVLFDDDAAGRQRVEPPADFGLALRIGPLLLGQRQGEELAHGLEHGLHLAAGPRFGLFVGGAGRAEGAGEQQHRDRPGRGVAGESLHGLGS